jgi:hypothetical protein
MCVDSAHLQIIGNLKELNASASFSIEKQSCDTFSPKIISARTLLQSTVGCGVVLY